MEETRHSVTRSVEYEIRLKSSVPVKSASYRVSDQKKKIIEEQVFGMLKMGIVQS